MARTFEEILEGIRTRFINNLTLQDAYELDPELTWDEQFSDVSPESQFTFVVANAIYDAEQDNADKMEAITNQITAEYPFTPEWYKKQFLAFQLGDEITFDDDTQTFGYAVTDASKQIIAFVAIRQRQIEGVTKLQVFISKTGKVALDADEKAAFAAYAVKIGAAGTHFEFISLAPDQLTVNLTVTYDPQILGNDGSALADGSTPVPDAVTAYLDGIKYSGKFNRTRCVDKIQAASGVLDVVLGDVLMNDEASNSQSFESPSGFFEAATVNVTYTPGNADDY